MCDSCFCILLARKSQHASSHIDRVDTSRCAIAFFVSLGQKITTCIIEHRVIDRVDISRHAISAFVFSWPEKHNLHHRTSTESTLVDVRYLLLYSLGQENHNMHHRTSTESTPVFAIADFVFSWPRKSQHASSHIDRVDTSRCAIAAFVFSWPENHNMHHRTSTEHSSDRKLRDFTGYVASKNCANSEPPT
jgi:hypothetical protein